MNKGFFIFGLFLILLIVGLKYIFVPMLVNYIRSQASQYIGSSLSSYLITADNLVTFCNAINSNVGIFGITVQDIAKLVSPDTVSKCNQYLILMQILSYEYIFYIVGIVLIVIGLAFGGKKEVIREVIKEVKHEEPEEEEEPEEIEKEPETKKTSDKKAKFCGKCGNKLKPNDKFCGKCGGKV